MKATSTYLNRPLRTLAQAQRDVALTELAKESARRRNCQCAACTVARVRKVAHA